MFLVFIPVQPSWLSGTRQQKSVIFCWLQNQQLFVIDFAGTSMCRVSARLGKRALNGLHPSPAILAAREMQTQRCDFPFAGRPWHAAVSISQAHSGAGWVRAIEGLPEHGRYRRRMRRLVRGATVRHLRSGSGSRLKSVASGGTLQPGGRPSTATALTMLDYPFPKDSPACA